MVTLSFLYHLIQFFPGHPGLHDSAEFLLGQEPSILCIKNPSDEKLLLRLMMPPSLLECFHEVFHIDLLLHLLGHHHQELIELYGVVELVLTDCPHQGQDSAVWVSSLFTIGDNRNPHPPSCILVS